MGIDFNRQRRQTVELTPEEEEMPKWFKEYLKKENRDNLRGPAFEKFKKIMLYALSGLIAAVALILIIWRIFVRIL